MITTEKSQFLQFIPTLQNELTIITQLLQEYINLLNTNTIEIKDSTELNEFKELNELENQLQMKENSFKMIEETISKRISITKSSETIISLIDNLYSHSQNMITTQDNDIDQLNGMNNEHIDEIIELKKEITTQQIIHYQNELDRTKTKYISKKKLTTNSFLDYISLSEKKQLEEWTSLKCSNILFDSNSDDYSEETSIFNDKIIGKSKLVFLIEDTNGEKFGYFEHSEIVEKLNNDDYYEIMETDEESFHFNLKSNGRLSLPMKFEIKETYFGYQLFKKDAISLIEIGNISLNKNGDLTESENSSSDDSDRFNPGECECEQDERFDYRDIENALCGKSVFIPKRIIVIQMS